MIKNGLYYRINSADEFEMVGLKDGMKRVIVPAFMERLNGELFGFHSTITKFVVEKGNERYFTQGNCLIERDRTWGFWYRGNVLIAGCKNSVIPADGSISVIAPRAFAGKAPKRVVIPEGVQLIAYRAFAESQELTSIYIPASVQEMQSPFERCNNLREIVFGGTREEWERITCGKAINPYGVEPIVYCKEEGYCA